MKAAIKQMKKEVRKHPHLLDLNVYLTREFSCDISLDMTKEVHMITSRLGYASVNGINHIIEITDEFLINYFEKLNLIMPTVKLFVISKDKLAFNIESPLIQKTKKEYDKFNIKIIGRLPVYIIGDQLYLDKDKKSLYYISGSGKNKELKYLDSVLDKDDIKLLSNSFSDGDSFKAIIAYRNLDNKYVLELDITNYKKAGN